MCMYHFHNFKKTLRSHLLVLQVWAAQESKTEIDFAGIKKYRKYVVAS